MNIFSKLQVYAGKWNLKASRSFEAEEIAAAIESIGTNLQSVSTGFTEVDEATAASMQ